MPISQEALDTSKPSPTKGEKETGTPANVNVEKSPPTTDIDPEDEVTGVRLYLIHTIICLGTFLVGLVSAAPLKFKFDIPLKNTIG